MKKITSITEYPFITMIMNNLMEEKIGEWIETEDAEEANKNFNDKYVCDNLTMDSDLGYIKLTYLNEGFLNGYMAAMEVMLGKMM